MDDDTSRGLDRGWHPDPLTEGAYRRFYDGAAWTSYTDPPGGPALPAVAGVWPDRRDPVGPAAPGHRRVDPAWVAAGFMLIIVALVLALQPVEGVLQFQFERGTASCGSVLTPKDWRYSAQCNDVLSGRRAFTAGLAGVGALAAIVGLLGGSGPRN